MIWDSVVPLRRIGSFHIQTGGAPRPSVGLGMAMPCDPKNAPWHRSSVGTNASCSRRPWLSWWYRNDCNDAPGNRQRRTPMPRKRRRPRRRKPRRPRRPCRSFGVIMMKTHRLGKGIYNTCCVCCGRHPSFDSTVSASTSPVNWNKWSRWRRRQKNVTAKKIPHRHLSHRLPPRSQ